MIHLIMSSPFLTQDLEQALRYRNQGDALVLMQDAVVAAVSPLWQAKLAEERLYVMSEDLQARGLGEGSGLSLTMTGLVVLIEAEGSPHSWSC
ncbi:sulfurtransferase complex subunit TusB [Aeromonas rivuli]|uniref:sulfurtransferase complex subunit TusB n=1 Tax=Aeromonas rivuli TaxID=648794 RepID=UPI001CCD3023|nr:sulfurtransferase complex subunit TusB [Aeromonas rivuli]UBO74239.1 sulfurtransferase complex subunit TusB [Aeromonas rivuli]